MEMKEWQFFYENLEKHERLNQNIYLQSELFTLKCRKEFSDDINITKKYGEQVIIFRRLTVSLLR